MIKPICLVGVSAILSGCAVSLDRVGYETAEVADKNFTISEWHYCEAQTLGAVRRKFRRNLDGLENYLRGCYWTNQEIGAFMGGMESPTQ